MSDITEAVSRLRATYDSGITRSWQWRDDQLEALALLLHDEQEAILGALAADVNKSVFEAYTSEIALVLADIENTRKNLKSWMKTEKVGLPLVAGVGASAKVRHEPLGVTLIIGAWNYPMMLTFGPLVGAIAGGNVAVIKPSELVPACSEIIARTVAKYLDPDAFAVIEGAIPETTELLAQRWDKIFFTGSPQVGKIVMRAAAENLTPLVLELGGKSPAIVCADANLDVAATRVTWGKFFNAGQTCVGVDYALVHESIYEQFLELVTERIERFYGSDPRESPDLARIVNLANLVRLEKLLEDQEIVTGGITLPDERYFAPTVLRDVDPLSPVMQEEIFGPILPVMPYAELDDAISFVNSGEIPLAAYIFSQNKATQRRLLDSVNSGGGCINDVLMHLTVADAPFGGIGNAGMGAYHGYDGYLAFTHRRTILKRSTAFDPAIRYPPYTDLKTRISTMLV